MTLTSLNARRQAHLGFFTGDELYISPSYADGKIYVVTSQKNIFVLDANHNGANWQPQPRLPAAGPHQPSPMVDLYVGCNDWNLYCFSKEPQTQPQPSTLRQATFVWISFAGYDCWCFYCFGRFDYCGCIFEGKIPDKKKLLHLQKKLQSWGLR